ncbi:MAG: excinuclease ABC subunit UvrA [Bacteroidales bacterium]|nr:excinuclease ABC subunit UvrA [Bacteroidales bacterium]
MSQQIDNVDARNFIVIKGAHIHNLKNLNVALPRNKLIVITGVSGSGKSSLAFDTLYAEGQRRYVESLSSYARQFLGRMSKPQVEYIRGIAPAIAIEQKVNTRNPRSTVGTNTEIYEYLKLLYARIGKTYSPVSGSLVQRDSVEDVVNYLLSKPEGTKAMIMAPMHIPAGRTATEHLNILQQQGFGRIRANKTVKRIDAILQNNEKEKAAEEVMQIVVDRVVVKNDKETTARMADSVQTAFFEGRNTCEIATYEDGVEKITAFSKNFEKDGIHFEEPSINFFSFNNPYGACKTCEGFGSIIGIDRDLVIPDKSLSVYEDAIAPWRGEKMSEWKHALIRNADHFNFPVHRPYYDLSEEEKELLWTGNRHFKGLNDFFRYLEKKAYKIQYRVMLSRYRGKTTCPACRGSRLREDAAYVKVAGHAIHDLLIMPVDELTTHFNNLSLSRQEEAIASRLLTEIANRLQYLMDVGLGYLTLSRLSNTLSGGESQRINLATSLGSNLVGSMYILDEPSIGLHPRDTHRLLKVLKKLRDIGNTVLVVEHEEAIINEADEIIDIGPEAGSLGGELVFQGTKQQMVQESSSLTADYLAGRKTIAVPQQRRKWRDAIQITGARHNNLQNIDVKFPLNTITTVTGVSGSGKTSLVKGILYPALKKMSGGYGEKTGAFNKLSGEYDRISHIELVDQNPIGKSSRSNPATYVKAFDDIRTLFANQPLAKLRGYKPGYFSFNIPGGRCEECEGEGVVKIEMQFMADIYLTCESCKGTRFKSELLEVKYRDHSVSDILNMTIDDAVAFLKASKNQDNNEKKVLQKLTPLADVGMGYVKLGQSANTLSGGEAQRIKLASFLSKGDKENPVLFIFDEPTTGLHFHDINKLLRSFNALVEKGHSVIVIEHNPEIIKSADWVIDLGPDGGKHGGRVMFEGTPEALAEADTHTSKFIREKLKNETDNF